MKKYAVVIEKGPNNYSAYIVLDFVVIPFHKPAPFLSRVGESGEYAFRRGGIAAFDNERAVNNRSFHDLYWFLSERFS
jgi:hypothetical protein